MNDYVIVYSSENNIYKTNDEYKIDKLDIHHLKLDDKLFNYSISIFFIEKELIVKETDKEIIFNKYNYLYLQNKFQYKRITIQSIYHFDIYVNLISIVPLNHSLISHIKKKIQSFTKQINLIEFKKLNKVDITNISNYDFMNILYIISKDIMNLKEKELTMESIYKKIGVTPKKIKVLYRGIRNVEFGNHDMENKYISTSVDPAVSVRFMNSVCCFQVLYNIDVPYVILNDSEKEYILRKKFYYHKIHVDTIHTPYLNIKAKCIHYVISVNKISSTNLKVIKKHIDLEESLLKIYESFVQLKQPYYHNNVFMIKDTKIKDGYNDWTTDFYKKKYKSLNSNEIKTILSWKITSNSVNSYSYLNLDLYYSILYELRHTSPVQSKTELNGFIYKKIEYSINNSTNHYSLIVFREYGNYNTLYIHPGIILKKIDEFMFIYCDGGILLHEQNEIIHIYPNNVEMKKNEIYFGNEKSIFDDYLIEN